jgi:hypothetical protein
MTLKKALLRGILGAPLGVFIGYTITILISLINPTGGNYYPVVPQLAVQLDSEIMAVTIQYVLSAMIGFAYAAGSAVFEVEHWGITKQTILHFIIMTFTGLPVAYLCHWMEHSFRGIVLYVAIFIGIYLIIWLSQMYFWSRRIKGINDKLRENK